MARENHNIIGKRFGSGGRRYCRVCETRFVDYTHKKIYCSNKCKALDNLEGNIPSIIDEHLSILECIDMGLTALETAQINSVSKQRVYQVLAHNYYLIPERRCRDCDREFTPSNLADWTCGPFCPHRPQLAYLKESNQVRCIHCKNYFTRGGTNTCKNCNYYRCTEYVWKDHPKARRWEKGMSWGRIRKSIGERSLSKTSPGKIP